MVKCNVCGGELKIYSDNSGYCPTCQKAIYDVTGLSVPSVNKLILASINSQSQNNVSQIKSKYVPSLINVNSIKDINTGIKVNPSTKKLPTIIKAYSSEQAKSLGILSSVPTPSINTNKKFSIDDISFGTPGEAGYCHSCHAGLVKGGRYCPSCGEAQW